MNKTGATRREFFKQSSLMAGAPAILGRMGSSFGQAGSSDILCGMIGTGGRGQSVLRAITKIPGVRVAALCDINPKALEQAQQLVSDHQPALYSFHQDLLAHPGLNAVLVETPPHLHREHTVEALEAGLHCSTAKPLALTVNELEDIRRAAAASRGGLHVDQQLRYRPQYLRAMEMIHRGDIGDVGFVRAQRYSSWDGDMAPPPPQDRKHWVYRIEQSGDTIVENQIHNLDVINWVMDDHPIRAAGLGGQNMIRWPGNELIDNYGLTLEYPNQRFAVFSKISYAVPGLTGTFIHAYGSKAGADVSYDGAVKIIWRGKKEEPTLIDEPDVDMDMLSMKDFFDSIREGRQPAANVGVGMSAALTALLGRKAIYEQRTVSWEELLTEGAPTNRRQAPRTERSGGPKSRGSRFTARPTK